MRLVQCSPVGSIEPEFHLAYEEFFTSGLDGSGFARHVAENPVREEEVINGAKDLANQLIEQGRRYLSQIILQELPPGPNDGPCGQRASTAQSAWMPTLNIARLGNAIATVRQQLGNTSVVGCENCGHTLKIPAGQYAATCRCGKDINGNGEVVRVA